MARERKYGWNGELPAKELSGQALIVLNALRAEPEQLRTGHEWTAIIASDLKTKQDPYRVVLYYLMVLKSKGCIRTNEFDIDAVTVNESTKHGITVKTESGVIEREVVDEVEDEELEEVPA